MQKELPLLECAVFENMREALGVAKGYELLRRGAWFVNGGGGELLKKSCFTSGDVDYRLSRFRVAGSKGEKGISGVWCKIRELLQEHHAIKAIRIIDLLYPLNIIGGHTELNKHLVRQHVKNKVYEGFGFGL